MSDGLKRALLGQWDYKWRVRIRPRMDGLTDEEFWWEPAPDCWTLKEEDGQFPHRWPEPDDPPPFTTIAWRMAHMIGPVLLGYAATFSGAPADWDNLRWPGTAAGSLAMLDEAQATFGIAAQSFPADRFRERIPDPAPGLPELTYADIYLHVFDELVHHGAEVAVLRDLYRARGGKA